MTMNQSPQIDIHTFSHGLRPTRSWTSFFKILKKSLNCWPIRNILTTKSTAQSANCLRITIFLLIMCFNNYSALLFHVTLHYLLYPNYLKFTSTDVMKWFKRWLFIFNGGMFFLKQNCWLNVGYVNVRQTLWKFKILILTMKSNRHKYAIYLHQSLLIVYTTDNSSNKLVLSISLTSTKINMNTVHWSYFHW